MEDRVSSQRARAAVYPEVGCPPFLTVSAALLLTTFFAQANWAAPLGLGNRAAREAAEQRVPYAKLTAEAGRRIRQVVNKPTLYRRMSASQITCDPKMHRFLVRYPEVVVNIWQLMGITKVSAERTGPFMMNASDGVGTVTNVELVYGDQNTHLMYCEGHYEGALFRKPLTGRCVLVLRADYQTQPDGTVQVSSTMDVFLQVDNMAVDVVTRTLHPLVGKSADINFEQSTRFIERVWQTTEENGPGMTRLAFRLEQVQPEVRQQFADITREVTVTAQQRPLINDGTRTARRP